MTRITERFGGLSVLLAGVAGVAAFAPFGWYPLASLSLAVLFNQWLDDTPRRAVRHGALFGAGFFGAGVTWVYVSIHQYGHVHAAAAVLVTAVLVVYLALFPALLGYFLKRIRHHEAYLVLGFPAGWVLMEWLRGWLFSGFPWLSMGASQVDGPLGTYAPLLGVFGVSWMVGLSAALLVALLRGQSRAAPLTVLVLIWAGGWLLERAEWTQALPGSLQVVLIQGNISQENKWAPEHLQSTLDRYTELTQAQSGSDLVVWPETAIPAFYHQVEAGFIDPLADQLQAADTSLLSGIPMLDRVSWRYFNAVLAIDGQRGFYYKRHLVPFGEYLPLRSLIGDRLDALAVPNADFSSGEETQPLLQAAGYPVGTSICFEVAFAAEVMRDLPEAALLVNVSNDAWFGNSLAPHQHLEMARMRAREAGRPMLRATNTGISAIIDHHGQIVSRSPQFREAVVSASVTPRQGATPYVLAGDLPVLVLALAGLLLYRFLPIRRNAGT